MHFNFETNFLWAPLYGTSLESKEEAFSYHECDIMIAIKSVWSKNEETYKFTI